LLGWLLFAGLFGSSEIGKDADDIRAGADGLLRLAGASAAPGRNSTTTVERRPLKLIYIDRDAGNDRRMETDDRNDDAA
jgi:hypothetical protein